MAKRQDCVMKHLFFKSVEILRREGKLREVAALKINQLIAYQDEEEQYGNHK